MLGGMDVTLSQKWEALNQLLGGYKTPQSESKSA